MKILSSAVLCGILAASVAVAQPAPADRPELPSFTLTDMEGVPHPVAQLEGVVTLINFWATWCGPCRMELPEVQKLYDDLAGKGLAVLAVNVEGPAAPVKAFMENMHLTLPVYFVSREDDRRLGITGIPFSVLVDRGGRVARVYQGYSPETVKDMRQLATQLIDEGVGRKGD